MSCGLCATCRGFCTDPVTGATCSECGGSGDAPTLPDGWTIEPSADPDGKGERFKLYDPMGTPRFVLGLTDELLSESDSGEALWQSLDAHEVGKQLVLFGGSQIAWLGTVGWITAPWRK